MQEEWSRTRNGRLASRGKRARATSRRPWESDPQSRDPENELLEVQLAEKKAQLLKTQTEVELLRTQIRLNEAAEKKVDLEMKLIRQQIEMNNRKMDDAALWTPSNPL